MRIFTAVFLVSCSAYQSTFGQDLFVVGKGGISSYGSVFFNIAGPASGDQNWKSGPILGLGVRLRTSKSFALEGLVEYSTHPYKDTYDWDSPPLNDPRNMVLDFSAVGRVSFHIIDVVYIGILGGPAVSWHQKDEVIKIFPSYRSVSPGRNAVDLGAVLGVALDARLSRRIEFSLEGTLRMRFYVTPVTQIGVAYAL